jgi:adenylate kinase family enzyme
MIIHISGTPGTGKTTLGYNIQKKHPKFKIFDTDQFLTEKDHTKIRRAKSKSIAKKIWNTIIETRLKIFLKMNENKVVILIGDLTNGSPDGTRYNLNKLKNKDKINKIFYYVDLSILIKRYYKRDVCNGLLKDNKFLNGIIAGHYDIPSTKQFIKMNRDDIKWHKKDNYVFMNEKQIINLMAEIGGLHKPGTDASERHYFVSSGDNSVMSCWKEWVNMLRLLNTKDHQHNMMHIVPFNKSLLELLFIKLGMEYEQDHGVKEMLHNKLNKKMKNTNKFKKMLKYFDN